LTKKQLTIWTDGKPSSFGMKYWES
jgi:hypothetical protein